VFLTRSVYEQSKLLSIRAIWLSLFSVSQLLLQGCVAPLAAISAVASSAGTTVATAAVANPVTASSIASTATTGKSPLEHAASAATKKECNFLNVVGPKPICQEIVLPKVTDNSTPLPGPADQAQEVIKQ
jgi:hypothetical protein